MEKLIFSPPRCGSETVARVMSKTMRFSISCMEKRLHDGPHIGMTPDGVKVRW